jgi:hypothetical protein
MTPPVWAALTVNPNAPIGPIGDHISFGFEWQLSTHSGHYKQR